MDDTEKHETIAKVTDRLAARYPETPRNLVASVVAASFSVTDLSGGLRDDRHDDAVAQVSPDRPG